MGIGGRYELLLLLLLLSLPLLLLLLLLLLSFISFIVAVAVAALRRGDRERLRLDGKILESVLMSLLPLLLVGEEELLLFGFWMVGVW